MQRVLACANSPGFSIGRIAALVSSFADAHRAVSPRPGCQLESMRAGVVMVMRVVMVMTVMRRVRQRDVRQKNQCHCEAN
jgi:hypothetical protein